MGGQGELRGSAWGFDDVILRTGGPLVIAKRLAASATSVRRKLKRGE